MLSWNVDGLCERGISERFSAVISEIKTVNPHVVSLESLLGGGSMLHINLGKRRKSAF